MPFTIRIVDRPAGETQRVIAKVDPGSKTTGIALVRSDAKGNHHLLFGAELVHRGARIRKAMQQRASYRRRRRSANLRYRAPRFNNRTRPAGWLPPSLQHRVDSTCAWLKRLCRWVPVAEVAIEAVRFDMQALQTPEITGVQYQQGTLAGYEAREYLLEKWGRKCAYCDATDVPLQIEHIEAKANGGSNRISNLTLACGKCNAAKAALPVGVFVKAPARLARIRARAKAPLRDAAAVNATRNALVRQATTPGLPVATATGGRTKFNRNRLQVPKSHMLDAACVGDFGRLHGWQGADALQIKSMGRGAYQRTRVNASGFPRGHLMRETFVKGLRTGDMVRASVPKGKYQGRHTGRVAVRRTGSFNITTANGLIQGISSKHCRLRQRADGYQYQTSTAIPPRPTQSVEDGVSLPHN